MSRNGLRCGEGPEASAAKKTKIEEKTKIKKSLKKIKIKEKKATGNVEKKEVKKKPLTTKKK